MVYDSLKMRMTKKTKTYFLVLLIALSATCLPFTQATDKCSCNSNSQSQMSTNKVEEYQVDGHAYVGIVLLYLSEDFWFKGRRQFAKVNVISPGGWSTDSSGKVTFQIYLHAVDDAWFHGADYIAQISVWYGGTFIGMDEWTKSSGNSETFDTKGNDIVEVSDTIPIHEVSRRYHVYVYGRIGQKGSKWDTDGSPKDCWVTVYNMAFVPYQQVDSINLISKHQLGDTVHISGKIKTEDGKGEPVSSTQLEVMIEVKNGSTLKWATEFWPVYTDSLGQWAVDYEIPMQWWYIGTNIVTVRDTPKDWTYYKADLDGATTSFEVEKPPGWGYFILNIDPRYEEVRPGRAAAYKVDVESIDFKGTVWLSVEDLPPYSDAYFNPNPLNIQRNGTKRSILTIDTDKQTPLGEYWLYVKGQSADLLDYVYFVLEVTYLVGGIVVPVDKFGLLAPYIGLASTILVATVATAVYIKHVKRKKEKQ
jgi:hypothetical protein